jgi:hypothetical protein
MSKGKNEIKAIEPEQPTPTVEAAVEAVVVVVAPIFKKVVDFVKNLPITPAAKEAADKALASVAAEYDVFIRNGNRTDWRRDAEAFASAKMEPILSEGKDTGKWAHTYSTMEGRRVDDIIYTALDHISLFAFPPQERADTKKDGTAKVQSRRKERENWIASLGYSKPEVGKGKRNLFGDAFADLKTDLDLTIPERFKGTEAPTTAKQMIALVESARRNGLISRINVYKATASEEKVKSSFEEIMLYVLDGCTFQLNDEGKVAGELASFYADMVFAKVAAMKAEADAKAKEEQALAEMANVA